MLLCGLLILSFSSCKSLNTDKDLEIKSLKYSLELKTFTDSLDRASAFKIEMDKNKTIYEQIFKIAELRDSIKRLKLAK